MKRYYVEKSSVQNVIERITAAICRYIKEYSRKIESMIQNEAQLENVNRTILKQCAADLETVLKRLEYGMNGTY